MVQVKIVKDGVKGADDGATVRPYAKGEIYRVSDTLAEVFIEAGEAVEVEEDKPTVTERVKEKASKKPTTPAAEKEAAEKEAAEKEAAEKEAAEKAAAEKEAAEKEAAAKLVTPPTPVGLPGLPKAPGK